MKKRFTDSIYFPIVAITLTLLTALFGQVALAADRPGQVSSALKDEALAKVDKIIYQPSTIANDWFLTNQANNLKAKFNQAGWHLTAFNSADWSWNFKLNNQLRTCLAADQLVNQINLDHGSIVEWYKNSAQGIEQGFTVKERPATGDLTLTADIETNLTGEWTVQGLTFKQGLKPVFNYNKLSAWDATGKKLSAEMKLHPAHGGYTLEIVVDAANAVYPVTIDPLASTLPGALSQI